MRITMIIGVMTVMLALAVPLAAKPSVENDAGTVSQKNKEANEANMKAEAVASRGQLLYENHCRVCHDSTVHIRENHKARSTENIKYWVTRWSTHLKLKWGQDEIKAVTDYLSKKYYDFKATP